MAAKKGGIKIGETTSTTSATATIMHTLLLLALLFFIPMSDASIFGWNKNPEKAVVITNNHTNFLSVRCFSFTDELELHHLRPWEQFGFRFRMHAVFPSSTMFNCSTNMGVFVAFKFDYDCGNSTINKCEWRFDLNQTYRYSVNTLDWEAFDYNPNYESLERGGIVRAKYTN